MTKKKLLIASDSFLPRWDGVSRFLAEVVPRLSSDYDITLVVPDFSPKGKVILKNVKIVRIPVYSFMIGDYFPPKFKHRTMKKLVKQSDLVFTQTIGPIGTLAIIYAKRAKKPLYSYIHSIEWELVPRSVDKFKNTLTMAAKAIARHLYNKSSMIFVPSKDIKDVLDDNKIKTEKKIVSLGVDSKEFSLPDSKDSAKEKIGIDKESIVISYIGRIGREKNLKTLYKAFREIKDTFSNLKLLIVGSGINVENMFGDMTDVVHVESTNKAYQYYQASDIFVLPSLTETSSLSTMEAMSCGLPVIATDVGCVSEYIINGKNGYIFQKKDHEELAKKLSKLIENKELRTAIGKMARKTITGRFSWEKTVSEFEKVFG
jgi:glycosyltransferase involved in cell wall biosynthesis